MHIVRSSTRRHLHLVNAEALNLIQHLLIGRADFGCCVIFAQQPAQHVDFVNQRVLHRYRVAQQFGMAVRAM